jgi:uncharacterized cupin superfamily protein
MLAGIAWAPSIQSQIGNARCPDGGHGGSEAFAGTLCVPPGKESFLPHAHSVSEEWVFVLEGAGVVSLDREDHAIGPGDFIGFPTDGTIHQVRNTGTSDLVYLTGGERSPVEVADMPSLGKVAVFKDNAVTFYDKTAQHISMEEWNKCAAIKTGRWFRAGTAHTAGRSNLYSTTLTVCARHDPGGRAAFGQPGAAGRTRLRGYRALRRDFPFQIVADHQVSCAPTPRNQRMDAGARLGLAKSMLAFD